MATFYSTKQSPSRSGCDTGRSGWPTHADVMRSSSTDLPTLGDVLAANIDATDLDASRNAATKDRMLTLPDASDVLHGDFHPGNVIISSDGAVVIDWIDATQGAPAADTARTLWLLSPATRPVDVPG